MDVLGRIAARLPHDDSIPLIVPLEDRAWANPELLANLGRY
jgi:hypothetical protein